MRLETHCVCVCVCCCSAAAFFSASKKVPMRFSQVRVQGSGFRIQGSGFRVQGSGFRKKVPMRSNCVMAASFWRLMLSCVCGLVGWCVCGWVGGWVGECGCVYVSVCIYASTYICVYVCNSMYVCVYVCMYVHTYYVLIKPPMPYIASSPLCLLRGFASCLNFASQERT